tara:strand:+ start:337 stop:1062 length:726 start_codon:yes stop_codon:yes gene_type:complete
MARNQKLKGGQAKIDANKDGKISEQDFVLLRQKKQKGGKAKKDVMDLKYAYQEGGEAGKRNGSMKDQMEGLAISVSPVVVEKEMMPEDNKEMKSDSVMEDDYIDFVVSQSLNNDEQEMLMKELESNPELSTIFDKVLETASEFAGSGPVEGPGSAVSDSIPARLSDGEFVFTAKAAQQIGADRLQRMMEDAEMQADSAGRQNMQEGGKAEEEKDTYGRPIMESDKDEEIKKAMLSANPRLA